MIAKGIFTIIVVYYLAWLLAGVICSSIIWLRFLISLPMVGVVLIIITAAIIAWEEFRMACSALEDERNEC